MYTSKIYISIHSHMYNLNYDLYSWHCGGEMSENITQQPHTTHTNMNDDSVGKPYFIYLNLFIKLYSIPLKMLHMLF